MELILAMKKEQGNTMCFILFHMDDIRFHSGISNLNIISK